MGPMGFLGLNVALKQRLVLKQESFRLLITQGLLRMLILSGVKEALVVTEARPRDLETTYNHVVTVRYKPCISKNKPCFQI